MSEQNDTQRLQERIAELDDLWKRAVAEQSNLAKRYARDLERIREAERAEVAGMILPVIDNLERALEHAESDPDAVIGGVRAVRDQAVGLLGKLGFARDDEAGVEFDPVRHEAVATVPAPDHAPGTVVQLLQPGYKGLRPAQVVVAAKAD